MKKRDFSLAGQLAALVEPQEHIETFSEYLTRRLLPYKAAPAKGVIAWDKENRGQGIFPGKNAKKREERRAAKLDRLAYIRWTNGMHGNGGRTPKVKRVPSFVFE